MAACLESPPLRPEVSLSGSIVGLVAIAAKMPPHVRLPRRPANGGRWHHRRRAPGWGAAEPRRGRHLRQSQTTGTSAAAATPPIYSIFGDGTDHFDGRIPQGRPSAEERGILLVALADGPQRGARGNLRRSVVVVGPGPVPRPLPLQVLQDLPMQEHAQFFQERRSTGLVPATGEATSRFEEDLCTLHQRQHGAAQILYDVARVCRALRPHQLIQLPRVGVGSVDLLIAGGQPCGPALAGPRLGIQQGQRFWL
mmetsp:Transcript_13272/g.23735  ORF Transcript_13272/g.23735 Transcript_13272/m.23735 type:complete len:253 (-) Transcript_13272:546-1304(-)